MKSATNISGIGAGLAIALGRFKGATGMAKLFGQINKHWGQTYRICNLS
jgi:hypothetical protein